MTTPYCPTSLSPCEALACGKISQKDFASYGDYYAFITLCEVLQVLTDMPQVETNAYTPMCDVNGVPVGFVFNWYDEENDVWEPIFLDTAFVEVARGAANLPAGWQKCINQDYEYKFFETCYRLIADPDQKYKRVVCVSFINGVRQPETIFWIDPAGVVTTSQPAGLEICPNNNDQTFYAGQGDVDASGIPQGGNQENATDFLGKVSLDEKQVVRSEYYVGAEIPSVTFGSRISLAASGSTTIAFAAADQIRGFNIQNEGNGLIEISYDHDNGDAGQHQIAPGAHWTFQFDLNKSAIVEVTLEEIDGIATDFIFNYWNVSHPSIIQ